MLLWDPEDTEGETLERMRASFKSNADESTELQEGARYDHFCIIIKNPVQFHLTIDYLKAGCSFHQAAAALQSTKECTGLAAIGTCNDYTTGKYACFACAINLQKLHELLEKAWTFSVALDMSTHMETLYLDIRIRLHFNQHKTVNAHLLAIPLHEHHTSKVELCFDTVAKALDVLCPSWRDIIIGISTDGEKKMTGPVSGVATRFENVTKPGSGVVPTNWTLFCSMLTPSLAILWTAHHFDFIPATTATLDC